MKALFDSLVRTVVPSIVGAVLAALAKSGMTIDSDFELALTAALTTLFGFIYYAAARILEVYVTPKFGWLLGLARIPTYEKPEAVITDVNHAVADEIHEAGEPENS